MAMTAGQKWEVLSTEAAAIHTFATKHLNDKYTLIPQGMLDLFINKFKTLNVAPSILCYLADSRGQSEHYYYRCPQGCTYKIEYYLTDGKTK